MSLKTMHRRGDSQTSIDSARSLLALLPMLQQDVYDALREFPGGTTGRELEKLKRFRQLGPSTVRKQIGELLEKGWVIDTGYTIKRGAIWRALSAEEFAQANAETESKQQRKMF